MAGSYESDQLGDHEPFQSNTSDWHSGMDIDGSEVSESSSLVKNIGKVVRNLRCIGFTSMTEDAYSGNEVYTKDTIKSIIQYAAARGVRIIPEIDMPGHASSGWKQVDESILACINSW